MGYKSTHEKDLLLHALGIQAAYTYTPIVASRLSVRGWCIHTHTSMHIIPRTLTSVSRVIARLAHIQCTSLYQPLSIRKAMLSVYTPTSPSVYQEAMLPVYTPTQPSVYQEANSVCVHAHTTLGLSGGGRCLCTRPHHPRPIRRQCCPCTRPHHPQSIRRQCCLCTRPHQPGPIRRGCCLCTRPHHPRSTRRQCSVHAYPHQPGSTYQ